MTNEATIDKMNVMKMHGMANAFKELNRTGLHNDMSIDEVLAHLVDSEWDDRYNRKLERLLKAAKFRYQAYIENLSFEKKRNLDKRKILQLARCDWIKNGENVIITGKTGTGKSYLASALGHQACLKGMKVSYFNGMKLFGQLKYSKADGTYFKTINKIANQDLIIVDDFGLKLLDSDSRMILLELLEDRYNKRSFMISSQMGVDKWFEIIGDSTIADAICDRLIHNSHKIRLEGDSLRKKEKVPLEN